MTDVTLLVCSTAMIDAVTAVWIFTASSPPCQGPSVFHSFQLASGRSTPDLLRVCLLDWPWCLLSMCGCSVVMSGSFTLIVDNCRILLTELLRKNTAVVLFLLQGIFKSRIKPDLHYRQILYCLNTKENPLSSRSSSLEAEAWNRDFCVHDLFLDLFLLQI